MFESHHLAWAELGISMTNESLSRFVREMERGIADQIQAFEERANTEYEKLSPEAKAMVDEEGDDELSLLVDEVPMLLRRAMFLSVYGAFEHELSSLCHAIHSDGLSKHPPNKQMDVKDSREYLRKYCFLKDGDFGSDWNRLFSSKCVRDYIAHNGGFIQDDDHSNNAKSAKDFIAKEKLLDFPDLGGIIVLKGFCESFLKSMTIVFGSVLRAFKTPKSNS